MVRVSLIVMTLFILSMSAAYVLLNGALGINENIVAQAVLTPILYPILKALDKRSKKP